MIFMTVGCVGRMLDDAAALMGRSGVRCAVYDEIGISQTRGGFGGAPVVKCACDRAPGYAVASALRARGHRRIAYITPLERGDPANLRGWGVEQTMTLTAGPQSIRWLGPSGRPPTAFNLLERDRRRLLRTLSKLPAFAMPTEERRYGSFDADLVEPYLQRRQLQEVVYPLFEQAYGDQSLSAWVLFNDPTAILALHWLAHRGVDVPGRLSVVSFDDSSDALGHGLASYDFNVAAQVAGLLDELAGHGAPETAIAGILRERTSMGAPAR
jgi:hypothetical protein